MTEKQLIEHLKKEMKLREWIRELGEKNHQQAVAANKDLEEKRINSVEIKKYISELKAKHQQGFPGIQETFPHQD